jgi:glycosyltransferase involved in cell wall biosynthesis
MKIVFVYPSVYTLGGIETWLTRMMPALHAQGHEVALLTRPPVESFDTSMEVVDKVAAAGTVHLGGRHWFRGHDSIDPPLEQADVLFAGNLHALLLAGVVQRHVLPQAKVVAGVFHPHEYCWGKAPLLERRFGQYLTERLLQRLPAENFVFCTPGMRRSTAACLGRDLSQAPLFPIPIDIERFSPRPDRSVERGKIVSVARLHPVYGHHDQMIGLIRDLRERGHDFTYHVYGDGYRRAELEDQVRRAGVEDAVFFHGGIPYARFPEVVSDAFAFIGTGTSLVEAAACGVPSLIALPAGREPVSHGWIQDAEDNEFGGPVPGRAEYPIEDLLLWLDGLDEREYEEVGAASCRCAERFGLDRLAPRFGELMQAARPFPLRISGLDRALGQLDWLLEAAILHLGGPDGWTNRYVPAS